MGRPGVPGSGSEAALCGLGPEAGAGASQRGHVGLGFKASVRRRLPRHKQCPWAVPTTQGSGEEWQGVGVGRGGDDGGSPGSRQDFHPPGLPSFIWKEAEIILLPSTKSCCENSMSRCSNICSAASAKARQEIFSVDASLMVPAPKCCCSLRLPEPMVQPLDAALASVG